MAINSAHIPVLEAARHWADRCLLEDGSVFTNGTVWTLAALDEFRVRFIENPLEDGGKFMEKLKEQLSGGSPQVCKLGSELLWVLYLFPGNIISAGKKSAQVREIWKWSGEDFPDSNVPAAFDLHIGHPGTALNTHRWREYGYLWRVTVTFKQLAEPEQLKLIDDGWAFAKWLDGIADSSKRLMRNILLHLFFPELFERIASKRHKFRIQNAFTQKIGTGGEPMPDGLSPIARCDWALWKIRQTLEAESPDAHVDFYEDPWRDVWDPEDKMADPDPAPAPAPASVPEHRLVSRLNEEPPAPPRADQLLGDFSRCAGPLLARVPRAGNHLHRLGGNGRSLPV